MTELTVSKKISASPQRVFELISDVTRMGEWSPEATGGAWTGGANAAKVGARFKGTNARGDKSWSTSCEVVTCEPGLAFAFEVTAGPLKVSRWAYDITAEPDGQSCTVTETWTDKRGWLITTVGKLLTGVDDRETHNRANMTSTLDALAAKAEAD